jgi:hypothetical protein
MFLLKINLQRIKYRRLLRTILLHADVPAAVVEVLAKRVAEAVMVALHVGLRRLIAT